jgi:hypothetical protein
MTAEANAGQNAGVYSEPRSVTDFDRGGFRNSLADDGYGGILKRVIVVGDKDPVRGQDLGADSDRRIRTENRKRADPRPRSNPDRGTWTRIEDRELSNDNSARDLKLALSRYSAPVAKIDSGAHELPAANQTPRRLPPVDEPKG